MAKELRPPFSWAVVESCYRDGVFDRAAAAGLLLAVGRPVNGDGLPLDRFHESLNDIAARFAFDRWHELQPPASAEEEHSRKLAHACRLVLSLAGMGDGEPVPERLLPFLGPGGLYGAAAMRGEPSGKAATMNALRAVWLLAQDAGRLAEIAAKRRRMKAAVEGAGAKEKRAIKGLIANLSSLYSLTWTAQPGISRDVEGKPSGPFVRLLSLVNEALWKRGIDQLRTADALAKTWERLHPLDREAFGQLLTE